MRTHAFYYSSTSFSLNVVKQEKLETTRSVARRDKGVAKLAFSQSRYSDFKKKVTRRRSRRFFIYGRSPTILAACKGTHVNLPPARVLTRPPVNGHYLPNIDCCSPNLSSSNWAYGLRIFC